MRNKLIKENPTQVPEFVQLVSNQHLQRWLSNFSYCIRNPALKFALITDMNRGMNSEAGIRTITIIRQHLKDIPILMYVLDVAKTKHVLYANKIPLVDNLRITNKKAEVE